MWQPIPNSSNLFGALTTLKLYSFLIQNDLDTNSINNLFKGAFQKSDAFPLFQANNAFANKSKNLKIIEANEFRVIDSKGVVKATFGMRESNSSQFIPSLRILTKVYGSDFGILIEFKYIVWFDKREPSERIRYQT